jgi:hypothetical protein
MKVRELDTDTQPMGYGTGHLIQTIVPALHHAPRQKKPGNKLRCHIIVQHAASCKRAADATYTAAGNILGAAVPPPSHVHGAQEYLSHPHRSRGKSPQPNSALAIEGPQPCPSTSNVPQERSVLLRLSHTPMPVAQHDRPMAMPLPRLGTPSTGRFA